MISQQSVKEGGLAPFSPFPFIWTIWISFCGIHVGTLLLVLPRLRAALHPLIVYPVISESTFDV